MLMRHSCTANAGNASWSHLRSLQIHHACINNSLTRILGAGKQTVPEAIGACKTNALTRNADGHYSSTPVSALASGQLSRKGGETKRSLVRHLRGDQNGGIRLIADAVSPTPSVRRRARRTARPAPPATALLADVSARGMATRMSGRGHTISEPDFFIGLPVVQGY